MKADLCADACPTVNASMQPDQHRKSARYDLILDALCAAGPHFLLANALQVLTAISDTISDKAIRAAARAFKEQRAVELVCSRATT